MKRSIWILLLGLVIISSVGVSFAQLRSTTMQKIICNMPCSSDAQCQAVGCASCLGPPKTHCRYTP